MSLELILFLVSLFTWGIGEGMFIYFQPIYLQQLGADTMTIAAIFSIVGGVMMTAHIPAGYLADRIGRKPLLVLAWMLGLIAAWVMALSRTLPVFVAGWMLYGLTAFVSSPMNSYVTAARGKLTTARAMTLASAAYSLGSAIGPIAGGWIGDRWELRTVYWVAACIFVLSTLMIWFIRSQPLERHDPSAPPARLLQNRRFIGYLGIVFLTIFAMYLPQPLTPKFLENVRGLTLTNIGTLGSIGNLGNAILALALGHFNPRLGFLVAQLAVAAFALLFWRKNGMVYFGVAYFLLGGFRAARALVFAQVRTLVHSAQMGLAYGVTETLSALAVILAPLLAGFLYTRNPLLVYPVSGGLILFSMGIVALFSPRGSSGSEPLPVISPPEA